MGRHAHPELLEAITATNDRITALDRSVTSDFEDIRSRIVKVLENDLPHAQQATKKIALAGPILVVLGYGARFLLQLLGLPIP